MPQITNASEAFTNMGQRFDAGKAAGVSGSIQFDLTGEGGGKWGVKIGGGTYELIEGGVPSPTTTLTMSTSDFLSMVNGTLNAMAAFMQGRIKLQGDMGLAMRFQTMFGIL